MSFKKLIFIITFSSIALFSMRFAADSDTFWHLATGEYIVETQTIPNTDLFSHTKYGDEWKGAQSGWLMQTLFYGGYKLLGYAGLSLILSVFTIATYWVIYKIIDGNDYLNSFLLIVGATSASIFWAARPFILSILLSAVYIAILENYQHKNRNKLNWLPLLMIIWVNGHGGFVIGFIFIGLYGLANLISWIKSRNNTIEIKSWLQSGFDGKAGKLIKTGIWMLLAVGINPGGFATLGYPFQNVAVKSVQVFIEEWQSPNFQEPIYWPLVLLLVLAIVSLIINIKPTILDILMVIFWGAMSLSSTRNIPQFSLVAIVVISRNFPPIFTNAISKQQIGTKVNPLLKWQKNVNSIIAIMYLLVVLVSGIKIFSTTYQDNKISELFPKPALDYIEKTSTSKKILNSYNWGGFIIWKNPNIPVFIDGRADLYQDEIILEWYEIVTAEHGWQDKLVDWETDVILIEPSWPINSVLESEGWHIGYKDEMSIVWEK